MKKILSILVLVVMLAALCVPTSAAGVYKTYAEAKTGDLLWIVDFNDKAAFDPQFGENGAKNFDVTVGDNGRSITIKEKASGTQDEVLNFWGGPIKGLEVTDKDTATMTFKVRCNQTRIKGSHNSTGIGGWLYNSTVEGAFNSQFLNLYSNWNGKEIDGSDIQNRSCLSLAHAKKANGAQYLYNIDKAYTDAEGFMTCKLEFDAPNIEYTVSYLGENGKWIEDLDNIYFMELLDDKPDSLCFMLYAYYLDAHQTIKDVKFFKGIHLTDAQLNAEAPAAVTTKAPETTKAPTTTKAPETTQAPTTTKAPAQTPATADASMLLVIVAAGMALTLVVSRRRAK